MTSESISKNKPLAISIFLISSIVISIAFGLATGAIGSFIYLVILFPILIGTRLGNVINRNAQDLKLNNIYLIIFSAFLCAIVLYVFYHLGRYLIFQVIGTIDLFGGISDKNLTDAQVIIQYLLEKETGHSGFVGYILYTVQEGISIGKVFGSSKITLSGWLAWLYFTLEFAIIAYLSITAVKSKPGQTIPTNEKS